MNKVEAAALTPHDALAKLDTRQQGLTQAEVQVRQLTYGKNALTASSNGPLPILARQFKSVLVYFLVVAAVLAFAVASRSSS